MSNKPIDRDQFTRGGMSVRSGELNSAPLRLNSEKYLQHLGDFDITEHQKQELLETLFSIMSTMVEIGWGVDTVQMFLPDLFENSVTDSDNVLKLKHGEKFNPAAQTGKGVCDD